MKRRQPSQSRSRQAVPPPAPPAAAPPLAHWIAQGLDHHRAGRLDQAEALYRQVLAQAPDHVDAWHLLGMVRYGQQRFTEAAEMISRALRSHRDAVLLGNLANVYKETGAFDQALRLYDEAIALKPDNPFNHYNLGLTQLAAGRPEAALSSLEQARRLKPDFVDASLSLGNAAKALNRLEAAAQAYREAIRYRPDHADAHANLGAIQVLLGQQAAAVASLQTALRLNPQQAGAYNNLGSALHELGRLEEARQALLQAIALCPQGIDAYANLGAVLQDMDRFPEAVAAYRQVLALNPQHDGALSQMFFHLRYLCDWHEDEALQSALRAAVPRQSGTLQPFALCGADASPAEQQLCARAYAARQMVPPETVFRHWAAPAPRLRLGYLSSDFHDHATAHLMAEVFELHDRNRFEVTAYCFSRRDGSAMRQRLERAFDRMVDLRTLDHRQAAEQIHADGIDILVDLKGYTQGARPPILAHRPAPIQVNYLGYPGTMGASFIDYILADSVVLPEADFTFYTEKSVWLPACYQPNDRQRRIAETSPTREALGLPAQGFVFCCFNNSWKISPEMFGRWMRILSAVPGSVLWLLETNAVAKDNLRRAAVAHGVAAERLIFASRLPLPEHLARQRQADLFLDTVPYNAHTTTSDALWAGLPVLTCSGTTFASRVAGSLLRAIGMADLIAPDLASYEARAISLASDPAALQQIRHRLVTGRAHAPLFETVGFTRALEQAYSYMVTRYRAGMAPDHFRVSPQGEVSTFACDSGGGDSSFSL